MRARIAILPFLLAGFFVLAGTAQAKTIVTSPQAKKLLLGRHLFSLQWISWTRFGIARVFDKDGTLHVSAYQRGRRGKKKNDYVRMRGRIERLDRRSFVFVGTIVTRVYHINKARPCVRRGRMLFRITGRRRFWRLKSIKNPCDMAADYVDIHFKRPRSRR
ncbi:MAG: hypothetical protein KJ621_07100 [Proteobacteria bacterium]|nr:hypothetical protein [Pseudomonadota bacterium]MBU1742437.1 hypothetical protein [Pseudomonadota bacterium]